MKQVILCRADLKMPKGKMASQCSHSAVEATLKSSPSKIKEWRKNGMKKVILKVNSESELLLYQKKARSLNLVSALITDAGRTFFKESTRTCLAIGPDSERKIDQITGKLKIY